MLLLDVASYQGTLTAAAVKAAGFSAVNLKISHGLTRKRVHPNLTGWIDDARRLGLGICTFHYMTADAGGPAQADYAYGLIRDLGLASGTAHQLDVESKPAPALSSVRGYLERMDALLGRPVVLYTGDWWWTARADWDVSDLTPYVWAAPNGGYLGSYPGDQSAHWKAGYGGWPELAVMQYAVKPVTGIDVSMSAIRNPAIWSALTGANMTYQPESCLAVRREFQKHTNLSNAALGIAGDDAHAAKRSSYHLGKSSNKSDSYAIVESSRDRKGATEAASANDIGWFSIKVGGKTHNLRTFSVWLVAQCKAGAADTKDIREVIYSPDGKTVKRFDDLGIRSTGDDSHLSHTHISWYRDSENRDRAAVIRRYFREIMEGDETMAFIQDQGDFNTAMTAWARSKDGRWALAQALLTYDPGLDAETGKPYPGAIANPDAAGAATNPTVGAAWALNRAIVGAMVSYQNRDQIAQLRSMLEAMSAEDIAAAVLAGLSAQGKTDGAR